MLAGGLLLLGALGLLFWNLREGRTAREAAERISAALTADMPEPFFALRPYVRSAGTSGTEALRREDTAPADTSGTPEQPALTMPTIRISGTDYLGILSIPSAGLELPVASEWDYIRLQSSPCRFSGNYLQDDLVICGHNYAGHFWPILDLPIGAEVYFTAADGAVYAYVAANRELLERNEADRLVGKGEDADWDLTLVTCTPGGQARCAVRCVRKPNRQEARG